MVMRWLAEPTLPASMKRRTNLAEVQYSSYVEYGQRFMKPLKRLATLSRTAAVTANTIVAIQHYMTLSKPATLSGGFLYVSP